MPELVCPRCKPGSTTLTGVMTCIARGADGCRQPQPAGRHDRHAGGGHRHDALPLFRQGRAKNLIGAGLVVGFKEEITTGSGGNGRANRWRLDYDPDKGLHVNIENDTLPKMAHRFARIDAQPFVAKVCDFPDGMANLHPEEQVKRMWFSWTKMHVDTGRQVAEVKNEMANAYKDIGITDADAFIGRFGKGSTYGSVSDPLTNPRT